MNSTEKYHHHSNIDIDTLKINMEGVFYAVQKAIDTNDVASLSHLFTATFLKKYQNSSKKLFLNNNKIHIDNIKLQEITNIKSTIKGVSADILFLAVTYTKHDKSTVHWGVRHLATSLSTNKEFGESSIFKQFFKQRWFFEYESQTIKVDRIKGIYLKQE